MLLHTQAKAQGKIKVDIFTNVNSFSCVCNEADFVYTEVDKNVAVLFPLVQFDCPKKMMERDLLELFNADNYPHAKLTIAEIETTKSDTEKVIKFKLTLKNISQYYKLTLSRVKHGSKTYLEGSQKVSLSDFKAVPPTKMMGLIKVEDEVLISFKIPEKELLPN